MRTAARAPCRRLLIYHLRGLLLRVSGFGLPVQLRLQRGLLLLQIVDFFPQPGVLVGEIAEHLRDLVQLVQTFQNLVAAILQLLCLGSPRWLLDTAAGGSRPAPAHREPSCMTRRFIQRATSVLL